jgi:hypothetical protein
LRLRPLSILFNLVFATLLCFSHQP